MPPTERQHSRHLKAPPVKADAPARSARGRRQGGDPTLAELEHRLAQAARIVVTFGSEYVPIFERLEREIEARRKADDAVTRARALIDAARHHLDEDRHAR